MAKRITDYPEETIIADSDYILLDSTTDGSRKIKAIMLGNGTVIGLSQSDYDALSNDEKMNGTVYLVANSKIMYLGDTYNKQ